MSETSLPDSKAGVFRLSSDSYQNSVMFDLCIDLKAKLKITSKNNMSIRNVARWAIGDFIECGYLSTDDSPLSTECLMDPPSNYCLATCKKADTLKK